MSEGSGIDIHIPRRLSWATVGGFFVVVAACVAGYLNLQASVAELTRALTGLSRTVETNYAFHIDQRVRVWNRINDIEAAAQRQREAVASINSRLDAIDRNLDRVLDLLTNDNRP